MQHIPSDMPSSEQHGRTARAARFSAGHCALLVLAFNALVLPAQAAPLADAAAAPTHESAFAPATGKLQARLDALQHITVTEQRAPAAEVQAASPAVQAVLDDAAQAERSASDDAVAVQD